MKNMREINRMNVEQMWQIDNEILMKYEIGMVYANFEEIIKISLPRRSFTIFITSDLQCNN